MQESVHDLQEDQKPRCFLVTVGTSLIGKYLETSDKFTIRDIEHTGGQSHEECMKGCTYRTEYNNVKDALGHYSFDVLREASAELKTLYAGGESPGTIPEDIIILIATNTPPGYFCATLLKEILTTHRALSPKCSFENVCIRHPQNLGAATDVGFADKGLPEFLGDLSTYIQEYQEGNYEVILMPTGGYKSLIPYATLAGILHEVPVKYIYEDSDKLLTLPPVPVGLDMEQWQTGSLVLKQIRGRPYAETGAWRERLPRGFASLISEVGNRGGISAIGKWLLDRFDERRYGTPLQAQTGHQVLRYFLKNNRSDLDERFGQLVSIGPYLWLGDKIPEMVDHGPYHHTNLFEMADRMLVPLCHADSKVLTAEELFIFLCVIYLHDCGHVWASFPGGNLLLPTQIRDDHHVLGYERLHDTAWRSTMWDRGLKWGSCPDDMWEKYLHVIAAVALFHRRKMRLRGLEPYRCLTNGRPYYPLENKGCWPLRFEEHLFPNDRALFLAALFRILDGLDNQLGRAGGPGEMEIKAAVLKDDAASQERQAGEVKKTVEAYFHRCGTLLGAIDELVTTITGAYAGAEGVGHSLDLSSGHQVLDIDRDIQTIALQAETKGFDRQVAEGLIRLYVDAKTRAFFKKEQIRHYFDHLIFDTPDIESIPDVRPNPHRIRITLNPVSENRFKELVQKFRMLSEDFVAPASYQEKINEIAGKIKSEYSPDVQSILDSGRIKVEYPDF